MNAKNLVHEIANNTSSLLNKKLSFVTPAARLEKVLFDTVMLITNNMEIDLKESAIQYDEIIIVHGLFGDGNTSNHTNTIVSYAPENQQYFNFGNNSNYYSGIVTFLSDKKISFTSEASGAWNNFRHPCVIKIIGVKYVNPYSYSTDEQMIGYWIDGKPLYQKTLVLSDPANNWTSIQVGIENVDFICKSAPATCVRSDGLIVSEFFRNTTDMFSTLVFNYGAGSNVDILVSATFNIKTLYIIVEYTKSTD